MSETCGENFNKFGVPQEFRNFCLGTEKLFIIWQKVLDQGGYHEGDKVLIPFGGPGSMPIFFDSLGILTFSGDIRHATDYPNPIEGLERLRAKHGYAGADQRFFAWDATKLPLAASSFKLAIVNPPYGINCPSEGDLMDLTIGSLLELKRVLAVDGRAYFVFPVNWASEFQNRVSQEAQRMEINLLSMNITSDPKSENPLCLIQAIKH